MDPSQPHARRAASDVSQVGQAIDRVHATAANSLDMLRSTSDSGPTSLRNVVDEDDMQIQQMSEELDRFMDHMREEPDILRSIVSRWPQAWDMDELKALRSHREVGLRCFEAPVGYKWVVRKRRRSTLKDTLFSPFGLSDIDAAENDRPTPISRQAGFLRDGFRLAKQALVDFTLIHLATYSHDPIRHICTLMDANADVNTPAKYHATFRGLDGSTPTPPNSPDDNDHILVHVSALHLAVQQSKVEVVRLLLDLKASPDSRAVFDTIPDFTPLHLAAAMAKERTEQVVHEAADFHQHRALQAATAIEDTHKVIRLLLLADADVRAVDLSGKSCLQMLFDLGLSNLSKWREGMGRVQGRRLQLALEGVRHVNEMETESGIFNGLEARLPDRRGLSQEDFAYLASSSAHLVNGQATPLHSRDLPKLFRKDFQVVNVQQIDSCTYVDCKLLGSNSGARATEIYRFPRYLATSNSARFADSDERLGSSDAFTHVPSGERQMARFHRRKDWRRLGVIATGHEYFEKMLEHLRSCHSDNTQRTATPIKRYGTWSYCKITETIAEEDEEVPQRPSTATGALSKSRTVGSLDLDQNPFSLMDPHTTHIDLVLDMPLPPGARYKKTWIIRKGCLLHYAVQMVIKSEEEQLADGGLKARPLAIDDLQLVLDAKADLLARAFYRGRAGAFCTTTALHMVTASGSFRAAAKLLKAGASIEVTSTMNGMAYYHPLHNAAYCGYKKMCELLLKERANPNTTNNEGRTGLHLAVKQNHINIVRILVAAKGNVVARDHCMHGGQCGTKGLTPLEMCRRATRQYSESERAEVMALLSPSFNGVTSFLFDLHSMALSSDAVIGGFLVDQALKLKTHQVVSAVTQLKAHAVLGQVTGCRPGFEDANWTPIDYVAEILLNAPRVGVRVLNNILLVDPDMEDNVRGALPGRANLKPRHQDSLFPWRRNGWFISPFLINYKADNNSDRQDQETVPSGRERWPCWLHCEDEPGPDWHRDLAPAPGYRGRRAAGDSDVQVKVLLLANAIDVRILRALARVQTLDIFAELIVQAIIACTFDQMAMHVTYLVALEEATLFFMFMKWARVVSKDRQALACYCWCMTAAIAIKETLVHFYCFIQHSKMGWPKHQFLLTNTWSHAFKLVRAAFLIMLVLQTRVTYLLDQVDANDQPTEEAWVFQLFGDHSPRKLLGTNIVIQGLQIVLLLRNSAPEAEFGRHILSIIHSFGRLWAILVVMGCFFFSFALAFSVMEVDPNWIVLFEKVYRGLLLADGDGLNYMEGKDHNFTTNSTAYDSDIGDGHYIERFISWFATCLFTICLLNISIAVFQTEYENALKESYLHFWQHRAFLCMQTLLGPSWPWGISEVGPRAKSFILRARSLRQRAVQFARTARRRLWLQSFYEDEGEPMVQANAEDPEAVQLVHWAGISFAVLFGIAAFVVFYVPVHKVFSAICLSISLGLMQALAVRTEAMTTHSCDKKFFLWICHKADFSPSQFIAEDVEKDDIREFRSSVEEGIAKINSGIKNLADMNLGRRLDKLEDDVKELDRRLASVTGIAYPSEMSSPDDSIALATAAADIRGVNHEISEVHRELEAALGPARPGERDVQDSPEDVGSWSLEWAAQHHPR